MKMYKKQNKLASGFFYCYLGPQFILIARTARLRSGTDKSRVIIVIIIGIYYIIRLHSRNNVAVIDLCMGLVW